MPCKMLIVVVGLLDLLHVAIYGLKTVWTQTRRDFSKHIQLRLSISSCGGQLPVGLSRLRTCNLSISALPRLPKQAQTLLPQTRLELAHAPAFARQRRCPQYVAGSTPFQVGACGMRALCYCSSKWIVSSSAGPDIRCGAPSLRNSPLFVPPAFFPSSNQRRATSPRAESIMMAGKIWSKELSPVNLSYLPIVVANCRLLSCFLLYPHSTSS